jgi:hypothetical protein
MLERAIPALKKFLDDLSVYEIFGTGWESVK